MATVAPAKRDPWDTLLGAAACAGAVLVPFFPDEKITRLKLEAVELWVLALLAIVGARLFSDDAVPGIWREPEGRTGRRLCAAAVLWLGVNAALWAISEKPLGTPELIRVATVAAALFVFVFLGPAPDWRRRFLFAWSFTAGLVSLYGILQRTGGTGPLMVPQYSRVFGTFGNPIFFSAYLTSSIFVTLAVFGETSSPVGLFLWACLALEIVALAFTETRSALIAATGAGVWAAYAFGRRPRPGTLIIVSGVLGIFLLVTRPMWGREQAHGLIWRDTIALWQTRPLTGVGLGAFHVHFPEVAKSDLTMRWPKGKFVVNDAHNEYLQTLAEGGPAALATLLLIPFLFFWEFLRRPQPRAPSEVWISAAVMAAFIQNVFSVDFRFTVSMASAFALMGLSAGEPIAPARRWVPSERQGRAPRLAAAAAWVIVVAALGVQRARWFADQRRQEITPDFFDQRLLDPAKTIADLESLLAKYPKQPEVVERLAFAYAKEMRRPDGTLDPKRGAQAEDAYRSLVHLDRNRSAAHNNLANVLFTLGKENEALQEWEISAQLDPKFIDPRLNLGKVMYVRGNLSAASKNFGEVLKIDPNNAEAQMYLRRMVE